MNYNTYYFNYDLIMKSCNKISILKDQMKYLTYVKREFLLFLESQNQISQFKKYKFLTNMIVNSKIFVESEKRIFLNEFIKSYFKQEYKSHIIDGELNLEIFDDNIISMLNENERRLIKRPKFILQRYSNQLSIFKKKIKHEIKIRKLGIQNNKITTINVKNDDDSLRKFPLIKGLEWREVKIEFKTIDSIKITAKNISKLYTYSELGFKDKKKGNLPNILWGTLYDLASNEGKLTTESKRFYTKYRNTTSNISQLRKRLKIIMSLFDDPFFPYKAINAYKAKFIIRDETSSNFSPPVKYAS
jgi:hypothetical protein